MKFIFILLNAPLICCIISSQSDVRLPPYIIRSPKRMNIVHFTGNDRLILECSANGTPAVSYEWRRNGHEFDTKYFLLHKEFNATLEIYPVTHYEGYYQCLAKNRYGTAISDIAEIKKAFIGEARPDIYRKTVVEGVPFRIQGHRTESFPEPSFDWALTTDISALHPRLSFSKRIQMAENGDLHFAYALPEDTYEDGRLYCHLQMFGGFRDGIRGYRCTKLNVTRTGNISEFAPTFAFSSPTQNIALIGGNVTLRCFFNGYPEPNISWTGPTNAFSADRFFLTNFETQLHIHNIVASDEGEYTCTAINTAGNNTHAVHLRVEARPEFQNTTDGPYNVNVTEGESVTFNCKPFAIPQANIIWLQNGQPINIDNPPARFVFSNDSKSLTIRNVCRECVDRESKTDLMVIQCNASNVHGYAFSQGYLNVLMKTTLTIRGSKEVSVDLIKKKEFVFHCHATSDPSRPAKVRWFKKEPYGDLVQDEPPYNWVENEFLIIVFFPNCSSNCTKYLGQYKCEGYDGYIRRIETIKVSYTYRQKPEAFRQNGYMRMSWKIFIGAGGIAVALFVFGVFLGFLSNRRSGNVKRRMKHRKIPNPPNMQWRVEFDSENISTEAMGSNERTIQRESSMYEHVGYASIGQVQEEIERKRETMSRPSGTHPYSRYESIDSPQMEAVSRLGPKIDEDGMYDDTRCSIPLEEEAINDGKTNQQQINGFSLMQKNSEAMKTCSDFNQMEEHSYLELSPTEDHPYLNLRSKEVDPYLDMDRKKVDPCLNVVQNDTAA